LRKAVPWQGFAEKSQPVVVKDSINIGSAVAAAGKDVFQLVNISDGVEIAGRLFRAETAVKVSAQAAVTRGTDKLADNWSHRTRQRIGIIFASVNASAKPKGTNGSSRCTDPPTV